MPAKKTSQPQSALLFSEAFVTTLLERVGEAGILVINLDGAILYAGERAARLFDMTASQLRKKNYFKDIVLYNERHERIADWQRPGWKATHDKRFVQVTPFFCWFELGDGSKKHIVQKATTVRIADESYAILEVREAKRNLKVDEMKTLFISFAAHQLKTPSSIVKGFIELLIREGKKSFSGQQWDHIESAYEANEQLINLSRSLLNVTKLEGGMIEPSVTTFDAREVIDTKLKTHEFLFSVKNLSVRVDGPASVPFVSDPSIFSEIFEILLTNAVKYSPNKGTIAVPIALTKTGITVSVIDEGQGVPAEQQKQLFAAFNVSQVHTNNHGLGLMMAKKYLELLGGTIGYKQGVNGGAHFYFSLPKPI